MALYVYLLALLASFRPAWADRLEAPAARADRLADLAAEIVLAVEAELPDAEAQRSYAVTLAYVAYRETTLRRDRQHACYRDRGLRGEDYGVACGAWSLHGPPGAAASLRVMRVNPGAWCLPRRSPWTGIPSAAEFLRMHPIPQTPSAQWETWRPVSPGLAAAAQASP